ncbi:hypothetical protein ACG95P_19875 [Acinetobacter guillouiae]|uniref:hypothetical protein n=1 Tax=Acinetobacter guillouiae TaxID=106649 RepID=UPI003AF8B9FF
MLEPRPYGLAVYGGDLTNEDRLFIDAYTKKVTNIKEVSNLESIRYTRTLPDGGYVVIQDMGGVFRAIAFKDQLEKQTEFDGFATTKIPMFFSGVITKSILFGGEGLEMSLTDMACRRIGNYGDTTIGKNQKLQRLRCNYTELFKVMFVPEFAQSLPEERLLYTQYHALRPTWYSGAMSEVVQIVGGFGRQKLEDLPDDIVERAELKLPEKYRKKIEEEIKGVRLPGYSGMPDEDGRILYDPRFHNTNLISFDQEGYPWLIQVSPSGVWAMPLPIIPATRTEAFREYIEEVDDTEIIKILDRFKGIPSGETFPQAGEFQRWERAGVISKIGDASAFYQHSAYSTVCGWSCNSDGSEAINTCYDYADSGYCEGYTFQLSLNMSAVKQQGWLSEKNTNQLDDLQNNQVSIYLSKLFDLMKDNPKDSKFIAIKYKLRRIDISQILDRAHIIPNQSEIDYWDNLVLEPLGNHTGRVSLMNHGILCNGIRIKIPEAMLFQGCISLNFTPRNPDIITFPKLDTIVFAYYVEDSLKIIKNFNDEYKYIKNVEGNFEDVMIVGSWEQKESLGYTGLFGEFYSTDFDDRTEFAPITKITKIVGMDKGYGQPLAKYPFFFWTDGVLSRSRYYSQKTNIEESSGQWLQVAFLVPYFNRNIAIYSKRSGISSKKNSESVKLKSVADPNVYNFWTYDDSWHSYDNGLKKTGRPFPVNSVPVWAELHEKWSITDYSYFADEGEWIPGLPADITNLVNPPTGQITLSEYGGKPPECEEYEEVEEKGASSENQIHCSIFDRPTLLNKKEHNDWFYTISPDSYNNVFYEDGCRVVFGNISYANISLKNEHGQRYRFGYTKLADHQSAHHFIGVINE